MPPVGKKRRTVSRRRFVEAAAGTGIVGTAGCLQRLSQDDEGEAATDIDPDEWDDLAGEQVHVITSETTEPFQELWEQVATDFESATDAEVEIEYAGIGGDYRERIIELQQAGMPPELAQSGIDEVSTWAGAGILGDLTPAMEAFEEQWGEFDDDQVVVTDDAHRLVPLHYNVNMYHWRDDIFEVGPRSEPFETTELIDLISEHHGTDDMQGEFYPTQNEYCARVYAHAHGLRFGGQMCEVENGEVELVLDSEYFDEWVEMVEWRQELNEYGITDTTADCGIYSEQLASGIIYAQHYFGARPKQISTDQEQPYAEHVRSAPEPIPPSDPGPSMGLVQGLTAFDGANVEAANEFMRFMIQPEYLVDYYMATPIHNAPVLEEVTNSDEFQSALEERVGEGWEEEDYMNHLEHDDWIAGPLESGEINPYYWDIFNSDGLWHMMYEALEEGTDAETAVEEGAAILQETIDELQ